MLRFLYQLKKNTRERYIFRISNAMYESKEDFDRYHYYNYNVIKEVKNV